MTLVPTQNYNVSKQADNSRDFVKPADAAWGKVVFLSECDDSGNCPNCAIDYGDCACFGPTEDGLEYEDRDGILYARQIS